MSQIGREKAKEGTCIINNIPLRVVHRRISSGVKYIQ